MKMNTKTSHDKNRSVSRVKLFKLIDTGLLLGAFIIFYITFLFAYYSPTKTILVDINIINEARIEWFLGLLTLGFGFYSFIKDFKSFLKNE